MDYKTTNTRDNYIKQLDVVVIGSFKFIVNNDEKNIG